MNKKEWNHTIESLDGGHILQSWEWGEIKRRYGWLPIRKSWLDDSGEVVAAAQILEKAVHLPVVGKHLKILYAPRGPLLDWKNLSLRNRVIQDLQKFSKERNAIFIKMDPEVPLGFGSSGPDNPDIQDTKELIQDLMGQGWRYSDDQIQFKNTVWIDLSFSLDELLARMKQKTRYNIRLSEKRGIRVRIGSKEDFGILYRLYRETAIRDQFVIRPKEYYYTIWDSLIEEQKAISLIAEFDNEPVAGIVVFRFGNKAWYFYGMSTQAHREKMPNHLLQWEAIKVAKSFGCDYYDLWGAPDQFTESDPMWGVYKFKDGFSGKIVRTIGAWDYPSNSIQYSLYTKILPKFLDLLRKRGNTRLRQKSQ